MVLGQRAAYSPNKKCYARQTWFSGLINEVLLRQEALHYTCREVNTQATQTTNDTQSSSKTLPELIAWKSTSFETHPVELPVKN
eukprot:4698843-Amphidinium_carterae.1